MASHAIPIGQRIRDLRVARGMTQEKLARMSNVDVKTIYRAERGEDAMRPETLLDIAAALEVSLDEICAPDRPDAEAPAFESEGHGNLVLRRVERASSLYALADASEHYSWSFQVDPDEATADAIREVMEIVRRATHGAERAADGFDARGEFSEPARVARLKTLIGQLAVSDVSVLANKFVHVDGRESAVVLRVLFVEGQVERRKEYASFELPRPAEGDAMTRAASKVIEGIGKLDFATRGCSVMGALELALRTIGESVSYDELMGASGMAFRVQMALPDWCPSAPYAGVGYDCVPYAADAIGRSIEWIPAEPAASHPMQRRIRAIVESIDRGVPALYGAEECGLVVGYHRGGEQLCLRTYFDPTDLYTVQGELGWPSPGILGEKHAPPARRETVRRALELAARLAHCEERFPTHRRGQHYACGFSAFEAWIAGLRDDARFDGRSRQELAVPIQANFWCYQSLLDARAAAGRYLRGFGGDVAELAGAYERIAEVLRGGLAAVPHPTLVGKDDGVGVGYGMQGSDRFSAEDRHREADALESALGLERQAVAGIERLLSSD